MSTQGKFRIYSKLGEEKAYLHAEGDAFSWVRSWRDATAYAERDEAKRAMTHARAAQPERPMCIVVWGTRSAKLPDAGTEGHAGGANAAT